MRSAEEKRRAACDAARRWRQTHPAAVRAQKVRAYQRATPKQRRRFAARNVAASRVNRRKVLDAMGGKCVRCGFDDARALQVDHVHGGGGRERAVIPNRNAYYTAVLANLEKYQLLCANCNWIKRHEKREFGAGRPVGAGR